LRVTNHHSIGVGVRVTNHHSIGVGMGVTAQTSSTITCCGPKGPPR
jgi:hypothetical protein